MPSRLRVFSSFFLALQPFFAHFTPQRKVRRIRVIPLRLQFRCQLFTCLDDTVVRRWKRDRVEVYGVEIFRWLYCSQYDLSGQSRPTNGLSVQAS